MSRDGLRNDAMNTVHMARELARRLREANPSHAWTDEECFLLAELCVVLGVDDEEQRVANG